MKDNVATTVTEIVKHLAGHHDQESHAPEGRGGKRTTLTALNKKIAPDKLYKGNGYFWFEFDDNKHRYSTSVAVYKISDMSEADWLGEYKRIKTETEDYLNEQSELRYHVGRKQEQQHHLVDGKTDDEWDAVARKLRNDGDTKSEEYHSARYNFADALERRLADVSDANLIDEARAWMDPSEIPEDFSNKVDRRTFIGRYVNWRMLNLE
jgi:hypothetical protein